MAAINSIGSLSAKALTIDLVRWRKADRIAIKGVHAGRIALAGLIVALASGNLVIEASGPFASRQFNRS